MCAILTDIQRNIPDRKEYNAVIYDIIINML